MSAPSPHWNARLPLLVGYLTLVAFVGIFGIWSVTAKIAGAVVSAGVIKVESNHHVIQHPQGGVVREVLVREGDAVQAGDTVLRLEDKPLIRELTIVEAQLFDLLARKARLISERDGHADMIEGDAPQPFAVQYGDFVKVLNEQRELFEERRKTLKFEQSYLSEQIRQTRYQIDGASRLLSALNRQEGLVLSELSDAKSLQNKGLAQASRVMSLQREHARLVGQIGAQQAEIARLQALTVSLELEKQHLKTSRREHAMQMLRDQETVEIELAQRRLSILDAISKQVLRSPVAGRIYANTVFTEQSVISPTAPIMYIVPDNAPFLVQTQVPAQHVNQIFLGQEVTIKLLTLEQRNTADLTGEVTHVSADVFDDQHSGSAYYKVEVTPNFEEMGELGRQGLLPGIPVEVYIQTLERSPLSYFIVPIERYFQRAFREG